MTNNRLSITTQKLNLPDDQSGQYSKVGLLVDHDRDVLERQIGPSHLGKPPAKLTSGLLKQKASLFILLECLDAIPGKLAKDGCLYV